MCDPKNLESGLVAARPGRCFECFRPHADCYCAAIPTIDNQTEIVILQHRRERFHPFNTARMVHRALRNSRLLVGHAPGFAARLALEPQAGLLYPGPTAPLLQDFPNHQRPRQLIVLDGTWHHARTLLRDIPALRHVPRYQIAPREPSNYRIRREPSSLFLSTVEATVAALRILEPKTLGLDQLLGAFCGMVERQLAHPKSGNGWRRNTAREQGGRNIPAALLGDLDRIVVAYAESVVAGPNRRTGTQIAVYWAAQRLGTGERFVCAIQPPARLGSSILGHLELTEEHFANALSFDEARAAWTAFQRPSDILAVYNSSTARLLAQLTSRVMPCLVLKSVDFDPQRRFATLDDLVVAQGLAIGPAEFPGRAGKRLASVVALIGHLRRLKHRDVS